jgi:hypothetical protein
MKTYKIELNEASLNLLIEILEKQIQQIDELNWNLASLKMKPAEQDKVTISISDPFLLKAPYGVKKDGTPAKRRGRPSIKKVEA